MASVCEGRIEQMLRRRRLGAQKEVVALWVQGYFNAALGIISDIEAIWVMSLN